MAAFRVVVIDDRAGFVNRERFPSADEVMTIESFENCCDGLEIDNDSFLVIVIRGHLHDRTALTQVLKTNAQYIGMMGSKRKRDELFKALLLEGFNENQLRRVHCPIGVEIKAATTVEIALSIVSRLILERAGGQSHVHFR